MERKPLTVDTEPHGVGWCLAIAAALFGIGGLAAAWWVPAPIVVFVIVFPGMLLGIMAAQGRVTHGPLGGARRLEMKPEDDHGWGTWFDGRPVPPIDRVECREWRWTSHEDGVTTAHHKALVLIWAGPYLWSNAAMDVGAARVLCERVGRRAGVEPVFTTHDDTPGWGALVVWWLAGAMGLVALGVAGAPYWGLAVWGLVVPFLGTPVSRMQWRLEVLGDRTPLIEQTPSEPLRVDLDRVSLVGRRGNGLPSVTVWGSAVAIAWVVAVIQGPPVGWAVAAALVGIGWLGVRVLSRPVALALDAFALTVGRRRVLWEELERIDVNSDAIVWQRRDGRRGTSGPLDLDDDQVASLRRLTEHLMGTERGPARLEDRERLEDILRRH